MHGFQVPKSRVYYGQLNCTLHEDLDVSAFEWVWQQIVDDTRLLRTYFICKQFAEALHLVHKRLKLLLERQDWRGLSLAQEEEWLEVYLEAEQGYSFDPMDSLLNSMLAEKKVNQ